VSTPANSAVDLGADRQAVRQARRETLHALLRSKTFIVGSVIILFWVVCALIGPQIAPHDAFKTNILYKHQPPLGSDPLGIVKIPPLPVPEGQTFWFGTDKLGRDVFSRVIVGSRDILIVCPLATLLGTILGTSIGLIIGFFRGAVDDIVSRILEALLALPVVIVGVTAIAALGPSRTTLIIVVGGIFTPIIARTVRSAVLSERSLEYVEAARLRGERAPYILFVEILPNILPPVLVEFTVRLGYAVFAVASLSFLGFGVQPPSPDWGAQIADSYQLLSAGYWWEVTFPALAIASLVVAVNLVADAIQGVMER
jgi:peptide/nickel transport system permease protein